MRDSEIVASIVARAPQGLAEAYDRYADSLYRYCRYALTDPAQAADAVRDTFIVAAARADRLRQPERLRAWLCAIARNECQRILRGGKAATAPGLADDEEPELRVLLEDAAWGLDPAEREIIELQLCQDLEPGEVAAVLGVSRRRANSRLRRAHHRLQDCVGALLVARAGQYECAVLGGMLADWDWRLTPRLRRRLHRHIGRCGACTARRAFEMRSAILQGLPAGLAVVAAAVDGSRLAAGPPAELRASTLALAADQTPDAIAQRAAMAGRAGVFRLDGFPGRPRSAKAAPPAATESWQSSPQGRTTAGVMLAVAITAVVVAFNTNPGFFRLGTPGPARSTIAAPVHGRNGIVLRRPRSTAARPATGAPTTPAVPDTSGGKPTATRTGSRTPVPVPTPAPTTPTTVPTTTQPSGTPTPTPTGTGEPSGSPTPSPSAGTLAVTPSGGSLTVMPGGATITLTAYGGAVDWSITVSPGTGHVGVSPSSGTLQAGASVTVTVTASHSAGGRQLTIDPGGTVLTIVIGWGNTSANAMSPATSYAIAGRIGF